LTSLEGCIAAYVVVVAAATPFGDYNPIGERVFGED
jgi:hypothetical protein